MSKVRRRPRTPSEKPLPNRLREWRVARGLSQEALAEKVQSSKQTVHRHETTTEISLTTLMRYAEVLGVRVEELLVDSLRVPQPLTNLVKVAEKLSPDQQRLLVGLGDQMDQQNQTMSIDPKVTHTN